MTQYNRVANSGDGTRPTTSGGSDNVGAGEKLNLKRDAQGNEIAGGPAPEDGMVHKRKDVEGTKVDDSAAYNLHEHLESETNKEDPNVGHPAHTNK